MYFFLSVFIILASMVSWGKDLSSQVEDLMIPEFWGDAYDTPERYYLGIGIDVVEVQPNNSGLFVAGDYDELMPESQQGQVFVFDNSMGELDGKLFVNLALPYGSAADAGVLVGSEVLAVDGVKVDSIEKGQRMQWFYERVKMKSKGERLSLDLKLYSQEGVPEVDYVSNVKIAEIDHLNWMQERSWNRRSIGFTSAGSSRRFVTATRWMLNDDQTHSQFSSEFFLGQSAAENVFDWSYYHSDLLALLKEMGCAGFEKESIVVSGKMYRVVMNFNDYPVDVRSDVDSFVGEFTMAAHARQQGEIYPQPGEEVFLADLYIYGPRNGVVKSCKVDILPFDEVAAELENAN